MKQVFQLSHTLARTNAIKAIQAAPTNYRVEIREPTRSMAQNDFMWSILTDISKQVEWLINGSKQKIPPEDWKDILTAHLKQEQRMAQGVNGGFVVLGQRTSRMTKTELSDLIALAHAFGSERGVVWSSTSQGRL